MNKERPCSDPFLIVQLIALVLFVAAGILASIRFSHEVQLEWARDAGSTATNRRIAL